MFASIGGCCWVVRSFPRSYEVYGCGEARSSDAPPDKIVWPGTIGLALSGSSLLVFIALEL